MSARKRPEGWEGWDDYAPFYDWENTRTLGRRDIPFWRRFAVKARGPVLELGCGTGRISVPLSGAGVKLVGIDRASAMLARAARKAGSRRSGATVRLVQGDIRALPFRSARFRAVLAAYGILQSLLTDRDLVAALASARRVLVRGGMLGIDLVPDVPQWREYADQTRLRGRSAGGAQFTLIESVRQDARRHVTTFDQRYVVKRGGRQTTHRFRLRFRTVPIRQMLRTLERGGFVVDAILGDYRGRPWDERADAWIILARAV